MAECVLTNGLRQVVFPENDKEFTREEIRFFVLPGEKGMVGCLPTETLDFWYDDEYTLKGLPFNEEATRLLWKERPEIKNHIFLCGVVFIATRQETGNEE